MVIITSQRCKVSEMDYYIVVAIDAGNDLNDFAVYQLPGAWVDVIGSGILRIDEDNAWASSLFVDTEFRGGGIGSRIITCMEDIALGRGLEIISGKVDKDNQYNIDLYKHLGAVTVVSHERETITMTKVLG